MKSLITYIVVVALGCATAKFMVACVEERLMGAPSITVCLGSPR